MRYLLDTCVLIHLTTDQDLLSRSMASLNKIITGKGEPSLKTGREISRKLNIDPAIVLGV